MGSGRCRTIATHQSSSMLPAAAAALQTKPRIGPANDPLEREADRVADAVVSNQALSSGSVSRGSGIQRMCADCAEEEKDTVRLQRKDEEEEILTKPADAGTTPSSAGAAQSAADAVGDGGVPLSASARSYFEPRLNADFSGVRIHTHGRAQTASRNIGARAYTLGRDIAFADGQFDERSDRGRHLLSHELTHVMQQDAATDPIIRRARYGTGKPPDHWKKFGLIPVPDTERDRVDRAVAIVDRTVGNRDGFSACHDHYKEKCPNGKADTLTNMWNKAVIWKMTKPTGGERARGDTPGSHMAYTDAGLAGGVDDLAKTLMHETGHNCGIPGDATHWRADQIAIYCIGPNRNEVSLSIGGAFGGTLPMFLVSYRRFLGDWASGRLRLTLGADLDIMGPIFEGVSAATRTPADRREPGEFGSIMAGGQFNLGGFGGTRFGGFSLRLETGLGAGRFNVPRGAGTADDTTTLAPSWILQVGPRAEFLIPISNRSLALPISIGAAYRLVQPLNSEAQALHGILGTFEARF